MELIFRQFGMGRVRWISVPTVHLNQIDNDNDDPEIQNFLTAKEIISVL
jgi:hypothetical protein